MIDEFVAAETATLYEGEDTELNLTASSNLPPGTPPVAPTATPTLVPTPTATAAAVIGYLGVRSRNS